MALTSGLGGQLSIDLGALARNWRALDKVSAGALTGAVVKADAYGTGITMASKALHAAGARFFFVATPDEGMAVRAAVPDAHIFVLNGLYPGAANLYIRQNLMPILSLDGDAGGVAGQVPRAQRGLSIGLPFRHRHQPAGLPAQRGEHGARAHPDAGLCAADGDEPPGLRRPADA